MYTRLDKATKQKNKYLKSLVLFLIYTVYIYITMSYYIYSLWVKIKVFPAKELLWMEPNLKSIVDSVLKKLVKPDSNG